LPVLRLPTVKRNRSFAFCLDVGITTLLSDSCRKALLPKRMGNELCGAVAAADANDSLSSGRICPRFQFFQRIAARKFII
jgi:hypothetical protein